MSCVRQQTKKYLSRPSPPFPANFCCGLQMQGNDGEMYISSQSTNGVCRWVKVKMNHVDKSVKTAGKAGKKSVRKVGKAPSAKIGTNDTNDTYRVTVVLRASPSTDRGVSKAQLVKHLKKYFNPTDVSELLEYGRLDTMRNLELKGATLTFEIPKALIRRRLNLKTKEDVRRWIMNNSLADGAWESGTSNFFVMKDDESPLKYPPEIATIAPHTVRVVA